MNTRDLIAGAGIGAALAFTFDPNRGRARRAWMGDKIRRAVRMTGEALDATGRDLTSRARGVAAATRGRLRGGGALDAKLVERVRARLGRACSHPRAIDVYASGGDVTLRGRILANEVDRLLTTISAVRGVNQVVNELEPHESAEGVPSLQGGGELSKADIDLFQRRWSSATRALVAAGVVATGAVAAYATRR